MLSLHRPGGCCSPQAPACRCEGAYCRLPQRSACHTFLAPTKPAMYHSCTCPCRMEWTDLHFRQLVRMLSRHTWLYTEMVVDKTLMHNPLTDK